MCISFGWSVWISLGLCLCSLFRAFSTIALACEFDIFARLSVLILAGSSALYICLC